MKNIIEELQKLQIKINQCEAICNDAVVAGWGGHSEIEHEKWQKAFDEATDTIEACRKRMNEILLNETPVHHAEVA